MMAETPELTAREDRLDITFYTCREEPAPVEEQPAVDVNVGQHPNITFDVNHYTTALCIAQDEDSNPADINSLP